jgi:hypothetical protein
MVRVTPPDDVLASWPAPNFDDPVTEGVALNVIAIFFLVLAYIIVGLRIYVRAWILRSFGFDDWLMVICLVQFLVLGVSDTCTDDVVIVPCYGIGYRSVHVYILRLGNPRVGPEA